MLLKSPEEVERFIKEKGIKHFKAKEFVCKHCGKVIIDSRLIELAERLREHLGKPLVITSGYRCPEHNRRVGGVPDSPHVKGLALDVLTESSRDRFKIFTWLVDNGVTRIGMAKTYTHFDIDPDKPQEVIWDYYD